MQPFAHELVPVPNVVETFRRFQGLPGCLLLDSAMRNAKAQTHALGRYSFLMAEPFDWIEHPVLHTDPFKMLRERLRQFRLAPLPGLPPMQGGFAGLLSYDLNRSLERSIPVGQDEFGLPALALAGYDTLIAWDHLSERAWLISSGFPELAPVRRSQRARSRIAAWLELLDLFGPSQETKRRDQDFEASSERPMSWQPGANRRLVTSQIPVSGLPGLTSNFSADGYLAAVQKCVDYIRAGDVFQVNLAQRLLIPATRPAADLYLSLRECNPAPFSAYFDTSQIADRQSNPFQIISTSPERLVAVRDRMVETRPIKGTRRRTGIPMVDIQAQDQLLASAKDRAENLMIVDLMRNDLSRCCDDDSVVVTQLCELEKYPSVFHLVSAVEGRLRSSADLVDLIEAVFPGGSITGAPKHRAMQIIGELEPHARGAYCGSLGYFGFDGSADFNILIRTITACEGYWQMPVGGGIVSRSKPHLEYEETWAKAAGLMRGLEVCLTQCGSMNRHSSATLALGVPVT